MEPFGLVKRKFTQVVLIGWYFNSLKPHNPQSFILLSNVYALHLWYDIIIIDYLFACCLIVYRYLYTFLYFYYFACDFYCWGIIIVCGEINVCGFYVLQSLKRSTFPFLRSFIVRSPSVHRAFRVRSELHIIQCTIF